MYEVTEDRLDNIKREARCAGLQGLCASELVDWLIAHLRHTNGADFLEPTQVQALQDELGQASQIKE